MAEKFTSELSGSLIFSSGSSNTTITPGHNALGITGSLNVSGSDITLNGTSVISRIETLEAGTDGGASLLGLNTFSGSTKLRLDAIETTTGSLSTAVAILSSATSSYITSIPAGTVSGSTQIAALGFVTSSGDATPSGTISSSVQIEDLGFVTSSGDLSAINIFTGSANTSIAALNAATASYITSIPAGTISGSTQIADLGFVTSSGDATPSGTISSSVQIADLGFVTSSASSIETGSFATTGSNVFKGQQTISGSLIPEANGQNNGIYDLGSLTAPWQDLYLTTASLKFVRDGQLVSQISGEPEGIRVGNILITTSSISVVSGSGDSLTTIQNVVQATVSSSGEVTQTQQTIAPEFTVSSSAQITAFGFISESGDTSYNGDRIVSNDKLGNLFSDNFNASTTGSITDFLNAVFFPNNAPSITSTTFTLAEYAVSGSTVGNISATDPEGQTLTFRTASSYTDDLVKVSSTGVITLNSQATASMNTSTAVIAEGAHPVAVEALDTFNAVATKTLHLRVTPNAAPQFRETSTSGTVITSVTVNLNENSTNNALAKRVFFTDSDSDSITITTSSVSPSNHFDVTLYSNYLDIRQNTSSLDYEGTTQYTFSVTASDSHYVDGDDTDSVAYLPVTINVTDNVNPTINNQTLSSISENSSDGATVASISAADSESDTITFSQFTLTGLELNNSAVTIGTYGGTSQATDPHENPFQMNSSGNVTRKTGVYINSDIIDEYQYSVVVKDAFNNASNTATITIPVTDDAAPTIYANGTFRIIESATTNDLVRTSTNGFSGTQARLTSNQSVTWSTPSSLVAISSTGYISLADNVSGSYSNGNTFTADFTASNSFGTENSLTSTFNVTENQAPTVTITDNSIESDNASVGTTVATVAITDQETDTPYSFTLSGTDAASFTAVPQNAASSSWNINLASALSAGDYSITGSSTDNFNKTGTDTIDLSIVQSSDYGKTFIYTSTRTGGGTLSAASYNGLTGITSVNSDTPPVVTGYQSSGPSPFYTFKTGSLGDSSITVGGGVMTLRATTSGSNLAANISASFSGDGTSADQILIITPSGSDLGGIPTSMTDSTGGSTTGEYVLFQKLSGESNFTGASSIIHEITLDSAHEGYSDYFVIGRQSAGTFSSAELRLVPSSGSVPS